MPSLYTVGHSTRSLSELIALLREAGIEVVGDVRRWPVSARFPHFGAEPLGAALAAHGIAYERLGTALGGYRDGGYPAWMGTPEFQAGLAALEARARAARLAVL